MRPRGTLRRWLPTTRWPGFPSLFWDTLHKFHSLMDTKFMVPVIRGKDLDLLVLYVEVTKRRISKGFIDGNFDCGYLVSVKMGSEPLRGVLCSPDQPDQCKGKPKSVTCNAIVPYIGGAGGHPNPSSTIIPYNGKSSCSGRRRRKRRGEGDPGRPKPNRSGYDFYFAEEHHKLKAQCPEKEREITKMMGASWNNLSAEENAASNESVVEKNLKYSAESVSIRTCKLTCCNTMIQRTGVSGSSVV